MILPDDKSNELYLLNRIWRGPCWPDQTYYERTPYYLSGTGNNIRLIMKVGGDGGLVSHLVGYKIMGGNATLLEGIFDDDQ